MRLEATRLHAISHNGGFGDSLYDSAGEFPRLDLNFAANKNLTDSITGRNLISFTRASSAGSATYVGVDGLIKTAVTNLLLRSQEISDTGSWSRTNVSLDPDVAVAPDGTLTADKLIAANGIAVGATRVAQNITKAGVATTYTFSAFSKTGDAGTGSLQLTVVDTASTGNNAGATFSTTLGTIAVPAATNGSFSNASSTITPFNNGWYRCSLTFTTSTETSIQVRLLSRLPTPGDGVSGLYVWGAQLEASATVGEYIPTTSTINSAPRFDHNPTTGESLGLLVEEARTNLILQSEDFLTTWGTNSSPTRTANTSVAPDGNITADTIGSTVTGSYVSQTATFTSDSDKAYFCFLKAGTSISTILNLRDTTAGLNRGFATVSWAGSVPSVSVSGGSLLGVKSFPNGWYQIIILASGVIAANTNQFRIQPDASAGTGNVIIWGFQAENGAFATSYIPTTTATVTRAADVASITGTNFSSWYNQTEGTFFGEGASTNNISGTTARVYALASNAATTEIFSLEARSATSIRVRVLTGGVTVLASDTYNVLGKNSKVAGAYGSDGVTVCADGRSPVTSASSISTPDALYLGANALGAGASCLNGTIKRLVYWATRLTNVTLQAITTP